MVSIEERFSYYSRIKDSPKLTAFYNLLSSIPIGLPNQFSNETEEIYYGVIQSIQQDKKKDFDLNYSKKSKSNPSKDSPTPFVNDDFLIFCLVLGVLKFRYDTKWIKSIIAIRSRNPITITLENILGENYFTKSNLPELVLMFLHLTNPNLITNDFLNSAYKNINENTELFESKNDIQIICSIKSFDLIIYYKGARDGHEIRLLNEFKDVFTKRVKILAWLVQTTLFILILYGIIKFITLNTQAKAFIDSIGSALKILGLLGLSQIGNIVPVLRKFIYKIVLKSFGYPKELINNEK
ncbi:MAG TPA: hypothetical protein VIH57_01125 [Bacteroidales bacterium]